MRTCPNQEYVWHLSTVQVLARDAAGKPLLVICFSTPIAPQSHLTTKVQRLLGENTFLRQHAAVFANLTAREREVLRQLASGFSSPEIAAALYISVQTVDTHRRNLRQKLDANTTFELSQYARAFDLKLAGP